MNGIEVVYLTHEGHEKLQAELKHLVEVRRREVAEMIRDAKADGDLRENAAYDEAKEQQGFVEGRIQELEDMLRRAKVIEEPTTKDIVAIGSRVKVVEDGEAPEEFRIVGSAEADPMKGFISHNSPLGAALLGKRAGQSATYTAPTGAKMTFKILEIG
ncbi:transcription elongation factor GreA [bacterium]|nr:transcription elongation factor GreA [Chloroflexi bacterium CFX6]RIL10146.1 MAG: transcription elongation factor GreA [bacterium]